MDHTKDCVKLSKKVLNLVFHLTYQQNINYGIFLTDKNSLSDFGSLDYTRTDKTFQIHTHIYIYIYI